MAKKEKHELVNEKLIELNKLIAPYQLAYVSPKDDCELLAKNAHYQDKDVFDKLKANIKEDGFLSQLPFALKVEMGGCKQIQNLIGKPQGKSSYTGRA